MGEFPGDRHSLGGFPPLFSKFWLTILWALSWFKWGSPVLMFCQIPDPWCGVGAWDTPGAADGIKVTVATTLINVGFPGNVPRD